MKILLVRPPVPIHTIGLKNIMICEPLELEYIGALLKHHQVMIFDSLVENRFEHRLKEFNPDIVASSCYKSGTNEVIKLFRKVKSFNPNCITVAGGVHATLVPEDFADEATDIIGIGDGTFLFPEIVECINEKKDILTIPGVAIPIGNKQLKYSPERVYMPKPDTLPFPDRSLVKHLLHKYYYLTHRPVTTVKTAWGCWYKCNFCFTWKITSGVAYARSPESIVEELKQIPTKDIYIVDDIFLIKPSRLKKLAELIRQNNIIKKYLVYARADFIAENEAIIKEWAELGLTAVFIGLEASTDEELQSMNKECSVNSNTKAVAILRKYKVDTYGSLIPGANYEEEDWQKLWKFIKDNGLYYVNISPETPLPATDMWQHQKELLTVPEDAHGLFDLSHILLPTKMPLKKYYRSLLKLYSKTILNISRARKETQRTLPSVWSISYFKTIYGSLKIGWQFWNAHKHHSPEEIKKAQYKGEKVAGLSFITKSRHPSFIQVFEEEKILVNA